LGNTDSIFRLQRPISEIEVHNKLICYSMNTFHIWLY